jgi:hypothetical protein
MTSRKRLGTWTVHFGSLRNVFYTSYHADQFARALTRNRTPWHMTVGHEWV